MQVDARGKDRQLSLWTSEPQAESSTLAVPGLAADTPWTLRDLAAFVVFAAFTYVIAQLVIVAIFLLLRRYFAWSTPPEQVLQQTPFLVLMQTGWEVLWFFFIYFTIVLKYRRRFWEAIRWEPGGYPAGTYLMAGVGVSIFAQAVFYLFPSEKELPIEKLFSSQGSAYLLVVFGVCVAPFIEELVFRGFFYPVFEKLWGFAAAVVLTAGLFALLHIPQLRGGWAEIGAIFVVGTVLSYCRGKTRSLWPPYLMHLSYNACLFLALYLSTDRFRALEG